MTDRTVKVTLVAQASGYIQGMDQAARKTRETGSEVEKLAQKRQAFQTLGVSALAFGTALAVGLGLAVSKFAEFDEAMSNVNAITQESAANQKLLRDAALEAGGATVYTASEAANAEEELAKAGLSTAQILSGALTGSLALAASGQLEVARAGEITAITLRQFNLQGSEASRVADVLSAGANKAVGSVEDLAQGLKFVGPVVNSMNVSLEDTVATLALFADQGIIGEQAGTSLRGMLSSLTSPSSAASKEIQRLGIQLYDANGKFLGLENATDQLHRALGGASDAERDMSLGIIFGNQQVTAARVLVQAGADTWDDYRSAVDDSGVAARIAAERMDNLNGDIEKLGGAIDTALIQTGSGANDVLRGLVQSITFLIDGVGELPTPVLTAGLAVGAVTAAVSLLGGGLLAAVPRVVEFRTGLAVLGISGKAAAAGIGLASVALAGLTLAVGFAISRQADLAAMTEAVTATLDKQTGAVTRATGEYVAGQLASRGVFDVLKEAGVSQQELTDAVLEGGDAFSEVQKKLADYGATWNPAVGIPANQADVALRDVRNSVIAAGDAWEDTTAATKDAGVAAENDTRILNNLAGAAEDTGDEVDDLADQIRGFGSATLDTREAERQFQAAIDDLTESINNNGATLDINTDAGRQNQAALDDIAKSALDLAAAKYEQTGSEEEATAAIQAGRDALIEQLKRMGITGDAAEAYADQLGLIPGNIKTVLEVQADTTPIDRFIQKMNSIPSYKGVTVGTIIGNPSMGGSAIRNYRGGLYEGGVKAFASGGFASGIYAGQYGGIHKFAESEMGVPWETYISGRPQDRDRNVGIWAETGERLGVWRSVPPMSGGGAAATAAPAPVKVEITAKVSDVRIADLIDVRINEADKWTSVDLDGGLTL